MYPHETETEDRTIRFHELLGQGNVLQYTTFAEYTTARLVTVGDRAAFTLVPLYYAMLAAFVAPILVGAR